MTIGFKYICYVQFYVTIFIVSEHIPHLEIILLAFILGLSPGHNY